MSGIPGVAGAGPSDAFGTAVINGVDVDAVAAAVRGCPSVADLTSGAPDQVATYLVGRRINGIRVASQPLQCRYARSGRRRPRRFSTR